MVYKTPMSVELFGKSQVEVEDKLLRVVDAWVRLNWGMFPVAKKCWTTAGGTDKESYFSFMHSATVESYLSICNVKRTMKVL